MSAIEPDAIDIDDDVHFAPLPFFASQFRTQTL